MTDILRPSRRRLLMGLGLGALAVGTVSQAVPAPAVAAAAAPECLADLVASGVVTRADLVAR